MKKLLFLILFFLLPYFSHAQIKSSVSIGAGITYPVFLKNYDQSWHTSFGWNFGISNVSYVETYLVLMQVGVKDYPDALGIENDNKVYQLGTGYRHYFGSHFFARGGLTAAIVNDGEASIRIIPNLGMGYDVSINKRQSIELSLKNDLIKNFDGQKNFDILSLGVAYKFWFQAK